jgi:hypothetical protein
MLLMVPLLFWRSFLFASHLDNDSWYSLFRWEINFC